jgi:hypothetical protein
MDIVIKILFSAVSFMIFIEDMKQRSVWIFYFILAFIFIFMEGLLEVGLIHLGSTFLVNIIILFIVFFLTHSYFKLKNKKNFYWRDVIGTGDIFFFIISALTFSTSNFILFLNFTTLLSLIMYLPRILSPAGYMYKIPLAGIQAGFSCIIQIISIFEVGRINPRWDVLDIKFLL